MTLRAAQDKREWDGNGWFEVLDNPISKVGVYPCSEASVKRDGDRNKMVGVYRPAEELGSEECVYSFKLMPWTDDHPSDLLGDPAQGFVAPEDKGVHGVIGEKVYFEGDTLYGNLKVFSGTLDRKIATGKRELSCGYHCDFVARDGVYKGVPYQYVQRNMRGNHVASVKSGRMGSDVRVLDAADTFTFALDLKEPSVPDKDKGMSAAEITALVRKQLYAVGYRLGSFDAAEITRAAREMAVRHEQLHARLSRVIGAVGGYEGMALPELATYGLQKLGIEAPDSGDDPAVVALENFLRGRAGSQSGIGAGMDAAGDSFVDRYINNI